MAPAFRLPQKPPPLSRIIHGHPLSQGLAFRCLFNEGRHTASTISVKATNLLNNNRNTMGNASATGQYHVLDNDVCWDCGSNGNWLDFGTDSTSSDVALAPFTVMARLRMQSSLAYCAGIVERFGGSAGQGWTVCANGQGNQRIGPVIAYSTTNMSVAAAYPTHGEWFWLTVVVDTSSTAANQLIYFDAQLQAHTLDTNGVGSRLTDVSGLLLVGQANFNLFGSFSHGSWAGGYGDLAIWRRKLSYQEILWHCTEPYANIKRHKPTRRKLIGFAIPQATFDNGVLTTGLTWMIVTARNGTQYVWSDKPLPDPSSYYLGWKQPRVLRWGKIRRALSSQIDGQYESSDFTVTLDDTDELLRQLDADKQLVNATVAVYMIDDVGRRAQGLAKTVYRGLIRDTKPQGTLQYVLTIKDTFQELFSVNNTALQIPRRSITTTDFANCGVDKVASSAQAYTVNGAVAAAATTVPVHAGRGQFAAGDTFTIGGNIYSVVSSSATTTIGLDPETSIEISPAVVGGFSGGEAITVTAVHQVQPAAGKAVPIWYGHITDRNVIGGTDAGDGQGPVVYVGDKVLNDGFTYGEFLWAGHACYSPSNIPVPMLYFWNEALDDLAVGYSSLGTLATAAGAGGRICLPGYGNWTTTNGLGSATYRDYNGRRYTVLYLRGVFRDWALGITGPPINLSGEPFAIDAYGIEDRGDCTGSLISNGLLQYKHIVKNWMPPTGEGYQSGSWLTAPVFADDATLPMIDEPSFDKADVQSSLYVSGGFRGDFGIGVNNERISARDLIARLNVSFGVQCGFNRETQFFVSMVNTNIGTTVLADPITWVRDIFAGTWEIESRSRELYTTIAYRDTQDYLNRVEGGWRSVTSGTTESENTAATTAYGAKSTSPQVLLYCVRTKNRSTDATEYSRGTDTRAAVVALLLARYSTVQHLPAWQTGPAGFAAELADTVPITHYEGLSNTGWTSRPIRIERLATDPSDFSEDGEGFDLDPMV